MLVPGCVALKSQTTQWDSRHLSGRTASGPPVYLYDGYNTIVEVDNSGSVLTKFTEGNHVDEWFAEMQSGTTTYYETDGGDSETSSSSSLGALTNTYTYDSFGKLTGGVGTPANPFQYTSREFDSETGLNFYRARYYDQNIGRFISEDPIGFGGGTHLYKYALNNPVLLDDPFGLWTASGYGPQPGDSTIICGVLGSIQIQIGRGEDTSCGMGKCIYEHENRHRQDALASNPGVCGNQPPGVQVTYSNGQERKASEIAASTVQLSCLADALNNAKCDHCKNALQKEIKKVEKYRRGFQ
jgi:RHS repeat-associated protein